MDHRIIGIQQKLFFFDKCSPGSCFFLPHGTRIYNKLHKLIKSEYEKRGFDEVITPNIFKNDLWCQSGHWDKYKENMFLLNCEKEIYGIKPMNCPSHCIIFKQSRKSYKELPIKYADFGVLHRNELSGTLGGLFRGRKFQQDDAHIFCRKSQIKDEIKECLKFLKHIYEIFGFEFYLELSTRPKNFIGKIELWDEAENQLKDVLNTEIDDFIINEGSGAFYGPKIDIHIKDHSGKKHQCGTIQLDFQLPIKFDLKYTNEDGKDEIPIMIHRAIYGSFERFIAILIEHYQGKFPFWLSPRQLIIIPISEKNLNYAKFVANEIRCGGYYVDIDVSDNRIGKKILEAQKLHYNYIIVVGGIEEKNKTINVRDRDGNKQVMKSIALLEELKNKKII